MPRWSETIRLPGGGWAVVCHSGKRAPACGCGRRATIQCDYPIDEGTTCDAWLCRACARLVGYDLHYCPKHGRTTP